MSVGFEDGRPVGDAAAVFPARNLAFGRSYSITADGSRMLAVQLDDAGIPGEIRVITGFFEEIHRVTGEAGPD